VPTDWAFSHEHARSPSYETRLLTQFLRTFLRTSRRPVPQ